MDFSKNNDTRPRPAKRSAPGDRRERDGAAGRDGDRNRNRDRNHDRPGRNDRPPRDEKHGRDEPRMPTNEDVPKGIAARRAAIEILTLIRDGETLDDALNKCRSYQAIGAVEEGAEPNKMALADKAFARTMATLALRRRGSLDHLITPYLNRPLPEKARRVMDILRITGVQLFFLNTPDHAAVSLAGALAKDRRETEGYAGLVNAIGRKLARTDAAKIESLPARVDTPAWLWRSWERAYGPMVARKIALAHRKPAPLDLSFKSIEARDRVAAALETEPVAGFETLPFLRLAESPGRVPALPEFKAGSWWVQDLAASLPVTLLGDVAGKRVLDVCAAPGGKTLQLAARGALVTALDKSEPRLERLTENLTRTGLKAETIAADATHWQPQASFETVLIDAPCTATGTIRRHPDLPWAKKDTDVEALGRVQQRLLAHAENLVAPGGTLIFCTCSLQAAEGEDQIRDFLAGTPPFERVPFEANELPGPLSGAVNRDGDLRFLPSMISAEGGVDGFFVARLRRL